MAFDLEFHRVLYYHSTLLEEGDEAEHIETTGKKTADPQCAAESERHGTTRTQPPSKN